MTAALVLALTGAGLTAVVAPATAADPILTTPAPPQDRAPDTATADSLPTVQIDKGVVWDQAIAANTVFAGGQFTQARPAGTSAGQQVTPRSNFLAYDIRTGDLLPFAPAFNGIVRAVEISPDGKTLYVGGSFTKVGDVPRWGLAAFDIATGTLLDTVATPVGGSVYAIAVTATTVYVGGEFKQVDGVARANLAAVTTQGELTGWKPTTNGRVEGLIIAPSGDRVIASGRFGTVNNVTNRGTVSLDMASGTTLPWALNKIVINSGANAGTSGIATDGKNIYGASWSFGGTASLEGTWQATPDTGALVWLNTGRGDHYDTTASGSTSYAVGHSHMASMIGGWPDFSTPAGNYQNSVALTTAPRGTGTTGDYYGVKGNPAPALVQWYPKWITGTFTGAGQAGWTIEENDQYVIVGGEFQGVNGKPQYGLARFPRTSTQVSTISPRMKPDATGVDKWENPTFAANPGGGRVSIRPNFDRDDRTLTYELYRSGTATPVARTTFASDWWLRTSQTVLLTDTSAQPNTKYDYTVKAVDQDGNFAMSAAVTGTTSSAPVPDYTKKVLADGASLYWRLGGSQPAQDWAGAMDGNVTSFSSATTGVVKDDSGAWATGSAVTASNAVAATKTSVTAGDAGTIELWMRSSSNSGGQLASFSAAGSGNSSAVYRTLYLRNDGKITFGVTPGGEKKTATTRWAYNDNKWHHVVATVGDKGMLVYVDGALVGSNIVVKEAGSQTGYWRLGTDTLAGWPERPGNDYLSGELDEFAVYPTALTRATVSTHYTTARGQENGGGGNNGGGNNGGDEEPETDIGRQGDVAAPSDAYGNYVYASDPFLYWRLGDAAGTTGSVVDSSGNAAPGKIIVTPKAFGQSGVIEGNSSANFTDSGLVSDQRAVKNPNEFTETTWFKTSASVGGRIMGLGTSATGYSGTYDRAVYMRRDGKLEFSVGAAANVATSTRAYNDGQWHQVAASLGADGMKLYVDGELVGSKATVTTGKDITGYWNLGRNYTPNGGYEWMVGNFDETAVFSRTLTGAEVGNLYKVSQGTMTPPSAAMSLTPSGYTLTADGSASVAAQGKTITSYDWDFGDGTTGTGVSASHDYTKPGTYRVTLRTTDSDGLVAVSAKTINLDYYAQAVKTSKPDFYWRFNEPAGATGSVADSSGNAWVGKIFNTIKFGQPGAFAGDGSAHMRDVALVIDQRQRSNPNTFTQNVWIKTTGTVGGQIMGFGDNGNGYSGTYDRSVYMLSNGKLEFGVGEKKVVTSSTAYNDGQWHMVTTSLGSDGQKLYVDGALVASNASVTTGKNMNGYWNVGRNYTWSPSYFFDGFADDVSLYSRTLSGAEVSTLYAAAQGSIAPTAALKLSTSDYTVTADGSASVAAQGKTITSYDWDFGDGSTGTGLNAAHTYAKPGTYKVTLRTTDSEGLTAVAIKTVNLDYYAQAVKDMKPDFYWRLGDAAGTTGSVVDSSANSAPGKIIVTPKAFGQSGVIEGNSSANFTDSGLVSDQRAVKNPNEFTETTWFKTSASVGGRIMGLGTSATGYSGTYDRTVYMRRDGKLEFSVGAAANVATSTRAYNDGQWHQVAASLGADGMKLYVDGELVGSKATVTTGKDITGYWNLGRNYTPNGGYEWMVGNFDETAVFSRTLTGAEVGNLYKVSQGAIMPSATFESVTTGQRASFDASASTVAQGKTITSYDWDFGDGTTGTGMRPVHDYTEVGNFPVTLRVSASDGMVGSATKTISVEPASKDPIAKVKATAGGMEAQFSASESTADADRTIASYAWDFGDGTTGTGVSTSHRYAAGGTYTVTLTVTDDAGRTGSASVEVTADATIASDGFDRTGSTWGQADVGGAWTTDKGMPVGDGVGQVVLPAAGQTRNAWLKGVSARDVDIRMDFSLAKASGGGGTLVSAVARRTDAGEYRSKLVLNANGTISVYLVKTVGGVETSLKAGILPEVTYAAGDVYSIRYQVVTSAEGSTAMQVRVWKADQEEPTAWFLKATDGESVLQGAGYVGVVGYLSGASTIAPQTVQVDQFVVTSP